MFAFIFKIEGLQQQNFVPLNNSRTREFSTEWTALGIQEAPVLLEGCYGSFDSTQSSGIWIYNDM